MKVGEDTVTIELEVSHARYLRLLHNMNENYEELSDWIDMVVDYHLRRVPSRHETKVQPGETLPEEVVTEIKLLREELDVSTEDAICQYIELDFDALIEENGLAE